MDIIQIIVGLDFHKTLPVLINYSILLINIYARVLICADLIVCHFHRKSERAQQDR